MGEYSVAVKNRFELTVEEDEDLYDILKQQQQKKDKKEEPEPVNSVKGKNDKTAAKSNKPTAKPIITDNKTQPNGPSTVTSRNNNENRPPRLTRRPKTGNDDFEKPPSQEGNVPARDNSGRGRRGAPREGGRMGSGRGGFGGRPGKREFERHSGSDKTGVKSVEKREGGGSHNWGDEINSQLDGQQEAKQEEVTEVVDHETAETTEAPVDQEVKEDTGPKEMTLSEWKAAQAATRVKSEFKTRKANEGVDPKQLKSSIILQPKKKEDSEEEEEADEEEEEIEDTRNALTRLNIQITFNDSGRGRRGGRGGRGGFRGDREGGYSQRGDRDGGFSGRGDKEGGFVARSEAPRPEGGFGGRTDAPRNEGGFGGRTDAPRNEGFGGRDGFSGRGDREGGYSSRGPRANRGRGSAGRSRGEAPLRVDDENDFPSLSK